MKIIVDSGTLFPEAEYEVNAYFKRFVSETASRFDTRPEYLGHLIGLFELLLSLNDSEHGFTDARLAVDTLMDWVSGKDKTLLVELFKTSNANWNEANSSFWSMRNSNVIAHEENDYREKVSGYFDTINKTLEFLVKKEGYLIACLVSDKRSKGIPKSFELFDVLQKCIMFFDGFPALSVNRDVLLHIPFNQWRNIAAHKDFACFNNVVTVVYGKDPKRTAELSLPELELCAREIYRFRVNIQFVTSVVNNLLAIKNEALMTGMTTTPKAFLVTVNYMLKAQGVQLASFSLAQGLFVEGEQQEIPEDVIIYDIDFESTIDDDLELCRILSAVSRAMGSIFGEYNSLPRKEQVRLHYRAQLASHIYHMVYTFDESDSTQA
ncbi:hypothetical protein [Pseudomonas sp. MH9.3]|uniref:hypothetical protein n=1 Tax=Pseudomonas sp. MH9.3 TaxID=3048630 RepID=UPI002AC939F6|nr:hypothetical protein [Pseudomonas sp. MH9.3]MEB0109333.1 hypothetical protein [Pseudomonas sp. MH9.3]WPX80752.1 hypothetical protein RHM60_06465 [Pseudomonas sp. MH9.3]WQG57403.1 hypothetical protein RHM66_20335 [Pseudomonas sp. RTB3]